jgi:hypothetical protein
MKARPAIRDRPETSPDSTAEALRKIEPVLQIEIAALGTTVDHVGEGGNRHADVRLLDLDRSIDSVRAVDRPAAAKIDGQLRAATLVDNIGRVFAHHLSELFAVGILERPHRAAVPDRTDDRLDQGIAEPPGLEPAGGITEASERTSDEQHEGAPLDRRLTRFATGHRLKLVRNLAPGSRNRNNGTSRGRQGTRCPVSTGSSATPANVPSDRG